MESLNKHMEDFDYFVLARTLHVIGVVIWISGVVFVTIVLIPSLKKITDTHSRLELFEQLEGRFVFQARIVTLITGVSKKNYGSALLQCILHPLA